MFAALPLEREPFQFQDLPQAVVTWIQVVGGFAAFGGGCVLAFLLWRYLFRLRHAQGHLPEMASKSFVRSSTFKVVIALVVLQYLVGISVKVPYFVRLIGASISDEASAPPTPTTTRFEEWMLTSASACALLVV